MIADHLRSDHEELEKSKISSFERFATAVQFQICHMSLKSVSWDQRVDLCNCQLPMFAAKCKIRKTSKENRYTFWRFSYLLHYLPKNSASVNMSAS